MGIFSGVVIAQAAVYSGMMTNFGRMTAQKLVAEGAELHFFASRLPIFGMPPPEKEMRDLGVHFHGLKLARTSGPAGQLAALTRMSRELRRQGVHILHTRSSTMALIGGLAGRLAGVPIVLNHQDDLHFRDSRPGAYRRRFFTLLERTVSRLFDRVFFVSGTVLQDALQAGFSPSRCRLVGHDLHPVFQTAMREPGERGARHPALHRYGVPEGTPVIGCIARLVDFKGIDTLIATAQILAEMGPECVFFVRGGGPRKDFFERMIEAKGLGGKVVICSEEIPPKELPSLYRSFDLFLLPTRREGFGMVFAEAMAMGIPVIGPRIDPVQHVIREGAGVLVEPENVAAYAAAVRRLLSDQTLRWRMGRSGYRQARRIWSGSQAADLVLETYREMLSLKSQPSSLPRRRPDQLAATRGRG